MWLPGEDYPVILPRTSEALYLLQRLRDEAHRFAITHQRKRRRRDIQSVLAEVPGLGDARIKALLRHFGSVAALKQATPAEIAELPGVGPEARRGDPRAPRRSRLRSGRLGATTGVVMGEASAHDAAKC